MIWDRFIAGFCEVQFLCYGGHPNWLGWLVLAFGAGVLLVVFYAIYLIDQNSRW